MTIDNTQLEKRLLAENEALREQVKDLTAANDALESRVFGLEHEKRGTPAPHDPKDFDDYYHQLVNETSGDL